MYLKLGTCFLFAFRSFFPFLTILEVPNALASFANWLLPIYKRRKQSFAAFTDSDEQACNSYPSPWLVIPVHNSWRRVKAWNAFNCLDINPAWEKQCSWNGKITRFLFFGSNLFSHVSFFLLFFWSDLFSQLSCFLLFINFLIKILLHILALTFFILFYFIFWNLMIWLTELVLFF